MISNVLFSNMLTIYEKSLNAASNRQSVISNNLANVDTPGFKKSYVTFEEELVKALNGSSQISGRVTNAKHIPIGFRSNLGEISPRVLVKKDTSLRNDGNNVDIDEEMANLAMNSLKFNALAQQVAGEFTKLKNVIKEGR